MEHDVEKVTANKDAPACADSSQGADSGATQHVSLKQASSHLSTGNDISLRAVALVHVSVRSLAVDVDVSPSSPLQALPGKTQDAADLKTILHNVSADMPSGTLTAIIGGSGSGKTTLLNLMSNRMHGRRLHINGAALFNGHDIRGDLSAVSAYVMQTDVLQPTLTVRETLQYAADLRLPASVDKDERRRVVDEVILELGLKEAADTRIGNNVHKGCSGGEKRRTSIGVQVSYRYAVLQPIQTNAPVLVAFKSVCSVS